MHFLKGGYASHSPVNSGQKTINYYENQFTLHTIFHKIARCATLIWEICKLFELCGQNMFLISSKKYIYCLSIYTLYYQLLAIYY